MFGMGGTEILVILIVALLFLGPDKLPDAAKSISKGIRDLRKQTREFQDTIEADEKIGGAIRDLKSALNGEEPRRVRPPRPLPAATPEIAAAAAVVAIGEVDTSAPASLAADGGDGATPAGDVIAPLAIEAPTEAAPAFVPATAPATAPAPVPALTLPPTAGESAIADLGSEASAEENKELAAMIKPAEGAIAKSAKGSTNGHG